MPVIGRVLNFQERISIDIFPKVGGNGVMVFLRFVIGGRKPKFQFFDKVPNSEFGKGDWRGGRDGSGGRDGRNSRRRHFGSKILRG